MKLRLTIIALHIASFINAQMILNAETLRVNMLKNKDAWSGNIGLSFSYTKNTNDIFNINSNLAIGYNGGKHIWMAISNINFNKVEGVAFQNSGVQHFRYNYKLSDQIAFESFVQGQYDEVFAIRFRGLAGMGTRFELFKAKSLSAVETNKKSRVFFGTLVMYEYERASEIENNIIRRDFRSSNYLTFSIYPTNQVTIISTTYYQPQIDQWKDYRLSSELNLQIGFSSKNEDEKKGFWDRLTMNLSFNYNYDSFPVASIPKQQLNISNGLLYAF